MLPRNIVGLPAVTGNSNEVYEVCNAEYVSNSVSNEKYIPEGLFIQYSGTDRNAIPSVDGSKIIGISGEAPKTVDFGCVSNNSNQTYSQTYVRDAILVGVRFVESSGGSVGDAVYCANDGTGLATLTAPAATSIPVGTLASEVSDDFYDSCGKKINGAYIDFLGAKNLITA